MAVPNTANIGSTRCFFICPRYIMAFVLYLQYNKITLQLTSSLLLSVLYDPVGLGPFMYTGPDTFVVIYLFFIRYIGLLDFKTICPSCQRFYRRLCKDKETKNT